MAFDFKTATPDTTLPTTGFLFGADSQAAADPSIYTTQAFATTLLGAAGLSGDTVTASTPVINQTQTWNSGAVTFTGWKLNVTDTASGGSSLLIDLQVGGTSRFKVTKGGLLSLGTSDSWSPATNFITLGSNVAFGKDAADSFAQRRGTNAQNFRVYSSYTDASNYELFEVSASTGGTIIRNRALGTGVVRSLIFRPNSNILFQNSSANTVFEIATTTGFILFGTDNTFDIGTNSASRPKSVYIGTSITPGRGVAVASLPTPTTGMVARVTDASAPAVGSTVTGGGAAQALVWYNGANWTVIGV